MGYINLKADYCAYTCDQKKCIFKDKKRRFRCKDKTKKFPYKEFWK